MAFKVDKFFVGPFKSMASELRFLSDLADIAPGVERRPGESMGTDYIAFGYRSTEHCGIISGGGWCRSDTIFTSSELLDMLRFNEE